MPITATRRPVRSWSWSPAGGVEHRAGEARRGPAMSGMDRVAAAGRSPRPGRRAVCSPPRGVAAATRARLVPRARSRTSWPNRRCGVTPNRRRSRAGRPRSRLRRRTCPTSPGWGRTRTSTGARARRRRSPGRCCRARCRRGRRPGRSTTKSVKPACCEPDRRPQPAEAGADDGDVDHSSSSPWNLLAPWTRPRRSATAAAGRPPVTRTPPHGSISASRTGGRPVARSRSLTARRPVAHQVGHLVDSARSGRPSGTGRRPARSGP